MAPQRTVEWSRLSPTGMEIVRNNYDEIAIMVEANRGDLKHVELPKGPVSKNWIIAKMRELRHEIAETHADATPD